VKSDHEKKGIVVWGTVSTLVTRYYLSVPSFLDSKVATKVTVGREGLRAKTNTRWRQGCPLDICRPK
jgi:hypothetical protein